MTKVTALNKNTQSKGTQFKNKDKTRIRARDGGRVLQIIVH